MFNIFRSYMYGIYIIKMRDSQLYKIPETMKKNAVTFFTYYHYLNYPFISANNPGEF